MLRATAISLLVPYLERNLHGDCLCNCTAVGDDFDLHLLNVQRGLIDGGRDQIDDF